MDKTRFKIPSLDGIRAIAISFVFLAHAGADRFVPGGFGVTVFFFLSGFLIATLIRREYEKRGRLNIKNFYLRRVFRILPPFYSALLLAYLLDAMGLLPGRSTIEGWVMYALHIGNYAQIFWPELSPPQGTSVYWSLAVEEHFYMVFPFLAALLLAKKSRRLTFSVFGSILILVLLLRIYLVAIGSSENRTYMGSDTRVDSILIGCALAFLRNPILDVSTNSSLWKKVLTLVLAVGLLLFCFIYRDPDFRETYRYTLQGIALVPVFYLSIRCAHWPLFKWLEFRPIRYFGQLSYTFYLLHYMILYAVSDILGSDPVMTGTIAALSTTVLAALSFHYLETPIAKLRSKYR